MSERTCVVCSEALPESIGRGRPRVYCSAKCSSWATRHLNAKRCARPGCNKPHRARGLCATHYNQTSTTRHQKKIIACAYCGALVEKYPSSNRRQVCSDECRALLQGFMPRSHRSKDLVIVAKPKKSRLTAPTVTIVPSHRVTWIAGTCQWCDVAFVKATTFSIPRTCSDRCAKRLATAVAEVRKGRFQITPARRARLYRRDNWTCQLCFEPIDRNAPSGSTWAPSLDHIVPQSQAPIPDHSDANLRTAHMWCNSVRGDDSRYTAADLVVA